MHMNFMIIFREGNILLLYSIGGRNVARAKTKPLLYKPSGERRTTEGTFCLSDLRLFRVGRTLYEERIAALHARPFTDGSQVTK